MREGARGEALDGMRKEGNPRDLRARALLFAAWLAVSLFLVTKHVFWRDEIRAFSFALQGGNVVEMLRQLHGEGHPALWYLLLRGAHAVVPIREVLPAIAWLVAAAAAALFAFRAPFRLSLIGLVLFSSFALTEYPVVARNYGISMLLLFAVAHLYPRWRDRGPSIGLLLALLCNTNVPSCLLAACFLLFWFVELLGEEGLRWHRKYAVFALNAALAAAGAVICFVTVYPTMHDAAPVTFAGGIPLKAVAASLLVPAYSWWALTPPALPANLLTASLFGAVVVGSLFGLVRAPGAFLSSLAAFAGMELLFQLVYPGFYRHQALLLVYLLVMYWLVERGRGGRWKGRARIAAYLPPLEAAGRIVFLFLLGLQVLISAAAIGSLAHYPYSQSRNLADLLKREGLENAVLIADPDMMLEPMPYYTRNPIYLMREQRWGNWVHFSRKVRQDLTPDDFLADGRILRARTGRPVVIVFEHRLDPNRRLYRKKNVHVWRFSANPEQVRRFFAGTRKLASFGPAISEESYDVYRLR
jgi:hypothetical protein